MDESMLEDPEATGSRASPAGVLTIAAALVVILVAVLAALMVFGVVPQEAFGRMSVKILVAAAIVAAASGAIALLIRSK